MYAVIFTAQVKALDSQYFATAARLRELAQERYGCSEFASYTAGDTEIAISYWPDLQSIRAWKDDAEHRQAQRRGRRRWYSSYRVQVVEVLREYGPGAD